MEPRRRAPAGKTLDIAGDGSDCCVGGEGRPGAGYSLELMFAAWCELETGSGSDVDDGARNEDLVRFGERADSLADMYCDAADVVAEQLDLAGMHTGSDTDL